MDHLYWDIGSCAGGACFEVKLRGSAARVCLMDVDDQAYLDGEAYEYHGGFCDVSSVALKVPYDALGRHRWVIERTIAWLNGYRRLHRRYERRADHFASFVALAAALICYRGPAKRVTL